MALGFGGVWGIWHMLEEAAFQMEGHFRLQQPHRKLFGFQGW